MGQVPEPGYALFSISPHSVRRSLIAWGSFAFCLFILAAIITWIVVGVKHAPIDDEHTLRLEFLFPNAGLHPTRSLLDTTIDRPRLAKLGAYTEADYREDRGSAALYVWYPPGVSGKILVSHLTGPDACQEVLTGAQDTPTETLAVEPIPATDANFHDDWIISVTPHQPHQPLIYDSVSQNWTLAPVETLVQLRCALRRTADRETFVTKRLLVMARDAAGLGPYMAPHTAAPTVYIRFPHTAGTESVEFSGGYSWIGNSSVVSPESERGVKLGQTVEVRWREADREGERDELLVIVGALIALGAAMMVEAVRPGVDRYIESRVEARNPINPSG